MTESNVQDFLTRFASAWAARDGERFLELWHPDGFLYYPLVDRPIRGSELAKLNAVQRERAPDFVWQLLDWTSRGDVVVVEWQSTRVINGGRFDWRGVDKVKLRDGKIFEERVYMDTALLRALQKGADAARLAAAASKGIAYEPFFPLD
jgi:ketosteroid isomerase-like protein